MYVKESAHDAHMAAIKNSSVTDQIKNQLISGQSSTINEALLWWTDGVLTRGGGGGGGGVLWSMIRIAKTHMYFSTKC